MRLRAQLYSQLHSSLARFGKRKKMKKGVSLRFLLRFEARCITTRP